MSPLLITLLVIILFVIVVSGIAIAADMDVFGYIGLLLGIPLMLLIVGCLAHFVLHVI